MPNIRIHEEVAFIYAKKHKEYDNKQFYLGVLAPDAVNVEGFAPKIERWTSHQRNKDYNTWRENIIKFYKENKDKYNKHFIYGYLFHVLTDIIYDDKYYLDVREKILNDNISLEDSHNIMRQDMDNYGSNFKEFDHIKNKLSKIDEYYNILNIDKDQLKKWKEVNLEEVEITKYKYITRTIIINLEEDVEKELHNIENKVRV